MRITTMTVTYGRRINLGDFNNAHVEQTVSAELEDGDDPLECSAQLFDMARDQVKARILPLVKKQADEVAAIFAGLPPELQKEILACLSTD